SVLDNPGNTPMVRLQMADSPGVDLYSKLEFCNPTGSMKDRAACYIIENLLKQEEIDQNTTLIESATGNFGIALASYCKKYGLKFICVVDPNITPLTELLIRSTGAEVFKVTEADENGRYTLARSREVNRLLKEIENSYYVNQYANRYNAEAYSETLALEICNELDHLDYLFVNITFGGTITGISGTIKKKFPNVKVIGVDILGSAVLGYPSPNTYIPGISTSMVPEILKQAEIDDVVMLDEMSAVSMCYELLENHAIFAGRYSGAAFGAVKKYFGEEPPAEKTNVVAIFPDRGERFIDTIYNKTWVTDFMNRT
ncbi:MAG: pyridoxal-phosphate dependent enzyme, partial [bacterium]|nr:pyridoxal-phosphate dependent enzyme [bacterium]